VRCAVRSGKVGEKMGLFADAVKKYFDENPDTHFTVERNKKVIGVIAGIHIVSQKCVGIMSLNGVLIEEGDCLHDKNGNEFIIKSIVNHNKAYYF
jgi:hypothetical protein